MAFDLRSATDLKRFDDHIERLQRAAKEGKQLIEVLADMPSVPLPNYLQMSPVDGTLVAQWFMHRPDNISGVLYLTDRISGKAGSVLSVHAGVGCWDRRHATWKGADGRVTDDARSLLRQLPSLLGQAARERAEREQKARPAGATNVYGPGETVEQALPHPDANGWKMP